MEKRDAKRFLHVVVTPIKKVELKSRLKKDRKQNETKFILLI